MYRNALKFKRKKCQFSVSEPSVYANLSIVQLFLLIEFNSDHIFRYITFVLFICVLFIIFSNVSVNIGEPAFLKSSIKNSTSFVTTVYSHHLPDENDSTNTSEGPPLMIPQIRLRGLRCLDI